MWLKLLCLHFICNITKDDHFAIAEPYCDYIFLNEIDKMKAFIDLVKHPKVKFIPLKEGLTSSDIYTKKIE